MKRHFEAKRLKWNIQPDQYNQSLSQANQYSNLVDTCSSYGQSVQVQQAHLVNQSQMYEQSQKAYADGYSSEVYQTGIAASGLYPQMARSQSDSSSTNSDSSSAPVPQYPDYGYAGHDHSWSRYMNFHFPTNQNAMNTFGSHQFVSGYQMKLEPTN